MSSSETEVDGSGTTGAEGSPGTGGQAEPRSPVDVAEEECVDCLPMDRKDDYPFTGCGCGDCDSESIEILCQAEGIKARAAYDAEHAGAPSPERYEAARLAYGETRYATAPRLADLETRLSDARETMRCLIDDQDRVDCLRRSWKKVRASLRDCRPDDCCVERYEFLRAPKGAEVQDLTATAARYAYVTTQAETCFDRLAREPELLGKRVEELEAQVDAIYYQVFPQKAPPPKPAPAAPADEGSTPPAAAAGAGASVPVGGSGVTGVDAGSTGQGEPPTPSEPLDWPHLYAASLVASWHLKNVYWGFAESGDFVRCLCRAMKVAMEGHAALGRLHGELRVRRARWQERNKCCKRLKANAAKEVMSRYERCVRGESDSSDEESHGDGYEGDGYGGEGEHGRGGKPGKGRGRRDRDQGRRDRQEDDRRHGRRRGDDDEDDEIDVDVDVHVDVDLDDDDERGDPRALRRESERPRESSRRGRGSRGTGPDPRR